MIDQHAAVDGGLPGGPALVHRGPDLYRVEAIGLVGVWARSHGPWSFRSNRLHIVLCGSQAVEHLKGCFVQINAERLLASLAEFAGIGATPGGGVSRLALSNEDRSISRQAALGPVRHSLSSRACSCRMHTATSSRMRRSPSPFRRAPAVPCSARRPSHLHPAWPASWTQVWAG